MSKIYSKYLELKHENPNKMYLFKSGKFYIFLADDCEKINEYVVLKKVNFSREIKKCGFPDSVLDNYLKVFKNHHLEIEIITDFTLNHPINLYEYITNLDIDNMTPIEAFNYLVQIKEKAKNEKDS